MSVLILGLAAALAFANGANDNCKGVASLVAYGASTPRRALAWAAVTTALGSGVSALWSGGLLAAFRSGFVAGEHELPAAFFAAVLAGAVTWVLLATRTGYPVSTTHALTGGLLGAGLLAVGTGGLDWRQAGLRFALPLALGPLLSLAVVFLAARPLRRLAEGTAERCVCLVEEPVPDGIVEGTASARGRLALTAGEVAGCAERAPLAAVRGGQLLHASHWATAGLVGFARGWNDTPKIAALALVALPGVAGSHATFGVVAAAMAVGGVVAGRRVLATLAHRVTPLPLGESLAASAAASTLVSLAAFRGLPVSTTHVVTGAIVGAGLARDPGGVRWRVVRDIAFAWIVTLPAAALAAVAAYTLLR